MKREDIIKRLLIVLATLGSLQVYATELKNIPVGTKVKLNDVIELKKNESLKIYGEQHRKVVCALLFQ